MASRLQIYFATREEFQDEFATNIANGGIFVATHEPPELRSRVEVVIKLSYLQLSLVLEGEVVHCLPADLAATGASPGVAIQFDDSLSTLRDKFAPYVEAPPSPEDDHSDLRRAERFPTRVATRVVAGDRSGPGDEARIRNLSSFGALVASEGEATPIGETIKLSIAHPSTGEEIEVEGTVARHEVSQSGEVTGIGIAFELPDADEAGNSPFLDDVRGREHSRRLGAITGPIEELGVSTLLTMFGTFAPCGTLSVTRNSEEGFVAIQAGDVRVVRLGSLRGREALAHMLTWRSGNFEFEASVNEAFFEGDAVPLREALQDALAAPTEPTAPSASTERVRAKVQLRSSTKLVVDSDAAEEARGELSQTDRAILDLAGAGVSVGKIVEVIPESKRDIALALSNLVKRGVISPA